MNLRELLKKQEELDGIIFERAGLKKYPYEEAKLALLTELGELANEVQCFKYWKQHKEVDREKVLEEFADCLHFALSLENQLNQTYEWILDDPKELYGEHQEMVSNINREFIVAYENITQDEDVLVVVMALGTCLGINLDEMEQAYLKKYEKNIRRQQEGY